MSASELRFGHTGSRILRDTNTPTVLFIDTKANGRKHCTEQRTLAYNAYCTRDDAVSSWELLDK